MKDFYQVIQKLVVYVEKFVKVIEDLKVINMHVEQYIRGLNQELTNAFSGWELANLCFKFELSTSDINRDNLNETIASVNSTIYNYFAENYGTVETDNKKDNDLLENYGDFSVNNPKKELKKLKRSNSDLRTIKFVSKRIRPKLKNNSKEPVNKHKDAIYAADHDAFVKHSGVWKYC